jgi:hypothetical protein
MHTQAPQPLAAPPVVHRIGVAMFTNGQPDPAQLEGRWRDLGRPVGY